jgi:hypothetical protein
MPAEGDFRLDGDAKIAARLRFYVQKVERFNDLPWLQAAGGG